MTNLLTAAPLWSMLFKASCVCVCVKVCRQLRPVLKAPTISTWTKLFTALGPRPGWRTSRGDPRGENPARKSVPCSSSQRPVVRPGGAARLPRFPCQLRPGLQGQGFQHQWRAKCNTRCLAAELLLFPSLCSANGALCGRLDMCWPALVRQV
jgi:hypothetical protein